MSLSQMIRRLPAMSPALLLCAVLALPASAAELKAPNVVPLSPSLTTAGQPTRASLEALSALGYEAVIYLAPPSVPDAVPEEGTLVGSQGLTYINIPIRFNKPTDRDFEIFAAAVDALKDRRLLVHCQVNMRASSMMFLYRVLRGKEDPETAYQDVTRVWTPNGTWKEFIAAMLKKHQVAFDLY